MVEKHASQFEKRAEKCDRCGLNRMLTKVGSNLFLCRFCKYGRKEL